MMRRGRLGERGLEADGSQEEGERKREWKSHVTEHRSPELTRSQQQREPITEATFLVIFGVHLYTNIGQLSLAPSGSDLSTDTRTMLAGLTIDEWRE